MAYGASRSQDAGQECIIFLERATQVYLAQIADQNAEFISLSHSRTLGGSLSHMYESRQATHEVVVLSSIVYVRRLIFNDKRFLPFFLLRPRQELLMLHKNGKR